VFSQPDQERRTEESETNIGSEIYFKDTVSFENYVTLLSS
jgi:hypothetical protein